MCETWAVTSDKGIQFTAADKHTALIEARRLQRLEKNTTGKSGVYMVRRVVASKPSHRGMMLAMDYYKSEKSGFVYDMGVNLQGDLFICVEPVSAKDAKAL